MPTAVDLTMKAMYVRGPAADVDTVAIQQLRATAPELDIATAQGAAEALAEIRRNATWRALLVSPALPHNETLALIATLRRDRVPMAIVPIVDEAQQEVFAAAIATGADDVLLRRGQNLVNVAETLARMRQSPHLFPVDERRRIGVLYAGRDNLVWNLLEQVPFVKAERVTIGPDGACPVRPLGSTEAGPRTDAVVIDEQPGDAHALQVLKSVKAQASDLPVIMLTSTGTTDVATAALELGADDTVLKSGIFRRRLIATLRRVHQRLELTMQQAELKLREERLRLIVEHVPTGIAIISSDGVILAMNAAALALFGASKPRDIVGQNVRQRVNGWDQDAVADFVRRVTTGEPSATNVHGLTLDGGQVPLTVRGVMLERDAKGSRGVIASLSPQGSDTTSPGSDSAAREQLSSVRDALTRVERHTAELEGERQREQAAWEHERAALEARVESAERVGAERASLAERLDEVTGELDRANSQFSADRETLEHRVVRLQEAAEEAATNSAAKAELEQTVEYVREELRQAIAAHALERSGWQSIREDLESRARSLDEARLIHSDRAATIGDMEARLRESAETLAAERARWTAEREQFEHDLHGARGALWNERSEWDRARTSTDAELGQVREILNSERSERAQERDAHAAEREAAAERLAALQRDLATAQQNATSMSEALAAAVADRERVAQDLERLTTDRADLETRLLSDRERIEEALRATTDEYDATRARLLAERDALAWQLATSGATADDLRRQIETLSHAGATGFAEAQASWDACLASLEADLQRQTDRATAHDEIAAHAQALVRQLADLNDVLAAERAAWNEERSELDGALRRVAAERDRAESERTNLIGEASQRGEFAREREQLQQSLQVLRSDYASMVHTLETERVTSERERERARDLDASLAAAIDRQQALERELDETAREAEGLIRQREGEHATRVQALERDLTTSTLRLSRVAEDAERARAALHAEFTRAAESHHRLISSDMFGYAVTTTAGELVRCNDAFAHLFGYRDAPDAMTRTAGTVIPRLANRPAIAALIEADGQAARVGGCLERVDSQAIRVIQTSTLLTDPADPDAEPLVEHVVLGTAGAPDSEELRGRRLEAVGALASEMAPELEALVTSLHERAAHPTDDDREISLIAGHVAALVRQLGAFSRRQLLTPQALDLSQVVLRAEPTLLRLVGDYIAFSTDLEDTPAVAAHADDLDQIVTSLVTLGRDLLPAGGSIVVATRPASTSRRDAHDEPDALGGPLVAVSASGYGVQLPERATALEQVAERAGGQLQISGEAGWTVRLEVSFPRCRPVSRARWDWIS